VKELRITGATGRKGVSSIIGALFLFMILFTVGVGFFFTLENQNYGFVKAQSASNARIVDRELESLLINGLLGIGNVLQFTATNVGGVTANVTAAYVLDSAGTVLTCNGGKAVSSVAGCTNTSPPLPVLVDIGQTSSKISTSYTYSSGTVTVLVLTASGKTYTCIYPGCFVSLIAGPAAKAANELGQDAGPVFVQASSLRQFLGPVEERKVADGYGVGCPSSCVGGYWGYVIPGGARAAYAATFINLDVNKRAITINKQSAIVLIQVITDEQDYDEYIVQGFASESPPYTSGVTLLSYTTGVTVQYGSTVVLYFGATSPGGNIGQSNPVSGSIIDVGMILYGSYSDGTPFSEGITYPASFSSGASISSPPPFSGCAGSSNTISISGFSNAPKAYISSGSFPTEIDTSSSTISVTFQIPSGFPQGYYQVYFFDNIAGDMAYTTFQVKC